ncbi:RNA polymerase subunit sigma-70 [Pseudoalteromonas sp. NBT06-2]|nr:RNA polymerase subunit sigma-70 [Pseudoalteromonas sp. NBT06-2]
MEVKIKNQDLNLDRQSTFTKWMTEHEKLLRHLITGFEAKSALQDELFQDIALNIWRALPSFRKNSTVKTFVARIAHNVLATHVAKAMKSIKTESDCQSQSERKTLDATPYQALEQQQRQQRLSHAIRQLNLEQRQVLTLALESMSYQEIADILCISTNLVGVRLQRAKTTLTQLLEVK